MEKNVKHVDGNINENALPHADEALEKAIVKGSEYWKMAKTKGQSLWNGTQSHGRKTWGWTKSFVQKHPGQAVIYSVVLGLVVGALLKSKGQD